MRRQTLDQCRSTQVATQEENSGIEDERVIWSSGATASSSFPGIPKEGRHPDQMEVAGNTISMNATNQEAGPEDIDVLDHGSVDPTLLDSLAEDLVVREVDNEDQCSSAGSESCWGETESVGDEEVVEWGVLALPSSINQGAFAHPVDTDDFEDCLPSPHVGRMGAARCESAAPRKRLRIRMGRESQATTIVGVESSDRHPASR